MAFRYLSWTLFPLLGCYAVYSLLYLEHKGWYSWVLSMLYGFLLTFGEQPSPHLEHTPPPFLAHHSCRPQPGAGCQAGLAPTWRACAADHLRPVFTAPASTAATPRSGPCWTPDSAHPEWVAVGAELEGCFWPGLQREGQHSLSVSAGEGGLVEAHLDGAQELL